MRQIRDVHTLYGLKLQQQRENKRIERFTGIIFCACFVLIAAMVVIDLWL